MGIAGMFFRFYGLFWRYFSRKNGFKRVDFPKIQNGENNELTYTGSYLQIPVILYIFVLS